MTTHADHWKYVQQIESEIAAYRAMPATAPEVVLCMQDEYGAMWWANGHVARADMVLAVVFDTMINVGAQEALSLLIGCENNFNEGPNVRPWRHEDQLAQANSLFTGVEHVWMTEDPNDEEHMFEAADGDPGATAWTRLRL